MTPLPISQLRAAPALEQKCVTRTLYGKKYDRLPRITWTKPDRPGLAGIAEKGAEFAEWAAAHEKATMSTVHTDRKKFLRNTLDIHLNDGILDPKRLRAESARIPPPPTFYYMAAVLEDMLRGDMFAPLPPCGVDEHKASWVGNRCKLRVEYMPRMLLYQLQTGNSQRVIAGKYGIDQATVSRHLWEIRYMLDTRGMLPTTGTMSDEIREAPEDSAFEIIGGFLNIDCKHTKIEAPTDKKSNGEAYSGRAHRTTCNSLFLCDKDGMLVGMGDPQPGRPAGTASLREALQDLGCVTDSLADPDTPPGRRITVNVDRGMAGIQHARRGANVRIPHKRPPGQDLTPEQRRENYETSSVRAVIEISFRRINSYRAIGGVYRGTIDDLGMTLNVLNRIVNLQRIMGTIDPSRAHRKGRRPSRRRGSRSRKLRKTLG